MRIENAGELVAIVSGEGITGRLFRVMTQVGYYQSHGRLINDPKPKYYLVTSDGKASKVHMTKGKKWTAWRNGLKVEKVVNQPILNEYLNY